MKFADLVNSVARVLSTGDRFTAVGLTERISTPQDAPINEREVRRAVRVLIRRGYSIVATPEDGIRLGAGPVSLHRYASRLRLQISSLQERLRAVEAVAQIATARREDPTAASA